MKKQTLEEKFELSHYSWGGDVFDTPEHQAALSKLKTIDEKIAYKDSVLKKISFLSSEGKSGNA